MVEDNPTANLAVFCDFENIAIGTRESNFDDFEVHRVIERLLLKGTIIVKKAYSDWEKYKEFKQTMHEAAFELIEIPHIRISGKNSADIRMVVDALDLCYTKPHVDTFVILSGDSDFSPLVSKLRENNKTVIGVGVKNSTSNLLAANCDEFIFYDDLVRKEEGRRRSRRRAPEAKSKGKKRTRAKTEEEKLQNGLDLIVETVDALIEERGDEEKIWGSMVKQTLKRRRPGFSESYYGFRGFKQMLEAAERQGLIELELDKRSGSYIVKAVYPET
ncbi:MAG TPA: NYN domain-containing protein [Candidatus Krumholzibacterium sp.]|nr:NYN domain-containing protein [Candidatus Krumholzibacterium sp.]